MKFRSLDFDNKHYEYYVGKSNVVINMGDGMKKIVPFNHLTDSTLDKIAITPQMIKDYLINPPCKELTYDSYSSEKKPLKEVEVRSPNEQHVNLHLIRFIHSKMGTANIYISRGNQAKEDSNFIKMEIGENNFFCEMTFGFIPFDEDKLIFNGQSYIDGSTIEDYVLADMSSYSGYEFSCYGLGKTVHESIVSALLHYKAQAFDVDSDSTACEGSLPVSAHAEELNLSEKKLDAYIKLLSVVGSIQTLPY